MVDLFDKYENALHNGCDRNCAMCDLFILSRDECVIEANKKWAAWSQKQHEKFEEVLKGESLDKEK